MPQTRTSSTTESINNGSLQDLHTQHSKTKWNGTALNSPQAQRTILGARRHASVYETTQNCSPRTQHPLVCCQVPPNWVKSRSQRELKLAAERRIRSVVSRYKRKLIGWDVINENLRNNCFQSKLGEDASALFLKYAYLWDPSTLMFMNEYNTIENSEDQASTPAKYLH